MQESCAGSVDADDEDRLPDLLPFDFWVLVPFAGERGVVAECARQAVGDVTKP